MKPFVKTSVKTCKRNFVKYKYGREEIVGLKGTKRRWIHRKYNLNFDLYETLVPDKFKLVKSSPECVPNGLELVEWGHQSTLLTIKDICKMKRGDVIDVAVIDRNVLDTDRIKERVLYKPTDFFKHVKGKYIHDHGLTGTLILPDAIIENFEFHVRLRAAWYPLTNGILPAHDKQHLFDLYDKPIKWQDMPTTMPVGFRGPMIEWSKLGKKPLYYSY
jgi:hypothetical protein